VVFVVEDSLGNFVRAAVVVVAAVVENSYPLDKYRNVGVLVLEEILDNYTELK